MLKFEEYFIGDNGESALNGFVQVVHFLAELRQFLDDVGFVSRRRRRFGQRRIALVVGFFQCGSDGRCVVHDPLQLDALSLISLQPFDLISISFLAHY